MSEQDREHWEEPVRPECCAGGSDRGGACSCGKTPWVWLGIPLLVLVLIVALWQGEYGREGGEGQAIAWVEDLDAALGEAQEAGRPVLVAFTASWCGPCQQMKKSVYPDPKVQAAVAGVIPVMIDTDEQEAVARRYGVNGIPAYVVLSPEGEELARYSGTMEAQAFANWLRQAAEG